MSIREALERSNRRVYRRLTDDAPLKGDDENVLCPFCDRPLIVRRTILGHLEEVDGETAYIDGVQMKCAGDGGCGFRPNFDVPIAKSVYDEEQRIRSERTVDAGLSFDDVETIQKRLRELGYYVE